MDGKFVRKKELLAALVCYGQIVKRPPFATFCAEDCEFPSFTELQNGKTRQTNQLEAAETTPTCLRAAETKAKPYVSRNCGSLLFRN
jgi:hypothetical protein